MPSFSLIIPMYNEKNVIADTARTLHQYLTEQFGDDFELIFSDDGSTDGCARVVEELDLSHVKVIRYETNAGKGCAVRTGMLEATGKVRMFTDADLAYGTDVIRPIYDMFLSDDDTSVVIGSRNIHPDGYEGYTWVRKIASKAYIKVLCVAGGLKLSDSQCGCKAFSGDAADRIFKKCEVNRFAFDFEAILWAEKMGLRIREFPVKVVNHRESKVHVLKDSVKMLRDLRKMKKRIRNAPLD